LFDQQIGGVDRAGSTGIGDRGNREQMRRRVGMAIRGQNRIKPSGVKTIVMSEITHTEAIKPTASISLPFNNLGCVGGQISGKYEWIEVPYAQH